MIRDEKRLERARKNGSKYLFVNMRNGRILGDAHYINDKKQWDFLQKPLVEKISVKDYEWLTDPDRKTVVVTCADLADKVTWTNSGFVICGIRLPLPKEKKPRKRGRRVGRLKEAPLQQGLKA